MKDRHLGEELFDANFYLEQNPDVAAAGIDPYEHFITAGRKEGRICAPPELEYWGAFEDLDVARKTVLVVSHEASLTGAPVLSLNIVRELKKKYNVVTLLLLNGGSIVDDFRRASDIVIGPIIAGRDPNLVASILGGLLAKTTVTFAIVNSIESRSVLPGLARRFVPTVTLIHEFAAYSRPRDAFPEAVFWSTETIFSASVTLQSAILEYPELNRHFRIVPQGRCVLPSVGCEKTSRLEEEAKIRDALRPERLPKDTIIVLGAGTVQIRKGVDLFISCAAQVIQSNPNKHCRFIWIGSGYDPECDSAYSIYLADQIQRSGLQQHVFFIGETPSIEAAYKAADIFLLSPRLDPLPNVAIDAMAHGLPIVCFEKATGIADILIEAGFGEVCVAPYFDTSKLASKVLAFVQSNDLRQIVGRKLQQLAARKFNIEHYVEQLETLALKACGRISQEQRDIQEIIKSGLPRLDFYVIPSLRARELSEEIRFYVRSWSSGVRRRKLFPGFHPGLFLEHGKMEESGGDPLANYLRAGRPEGPWCHEVMTSDEVAKPHASISVALHIHVYYPDMLPEIILRLESNDIRPDLFVSVPSKRVGDEVTDLLTGYSGKVLDVCIVPNSGRDIGAFLSAFGPVSVDYDVVGHLHTKKSLELKDELIGKNWFCFLLENLVGGKKNMADIVLGRMAADPSIGIVFPDDPYLVGWEKNRHYAEILGGRLGLNALPENIVFPVGSMFWARVEALRPLFNLKLTWRDYPVEPLPYDGTILHALERLIPLVAAQQSTRTMLTNVRGITR